MKFDPGLLVYQAIYKRLPPEPPTTESEWTMLGPIQKWQLFGKFPWKLCLHLSLTICTLLQVVERTESVSNVNYNALETWKHFFLPDNAEWIEGQYTAYLYSVGEVNSTMRNIVQKYYSLGDTSLDVLDSHGGAWDFSELPPLPNPILTMTSLASPVSFDRLFETRDSSTMTETFELTAEYPTGPLNNTDSKNIKQKIFSRLLTMDLALEFYMADISHGSRARCSHWIVNIIFDFRTRGGRMALKLDSRSDICNPYHTDLQIIFQLDRRFPCIAAVTIFFAACNIFLTLKAFASALKLGVKTIRRNEILEQQRPTSTSRRNTHTEEEIKMMSQSLRSINFTEIKKRKKLKTRIDKFIAIFYFIRVRDFVSLVAASLSMTFSFISAFTNLDFVSDDTSLSLILGLAIFLYFTEFIFYLRYFPRQYLLNLSVRRALPQVLRLLMGVLPVYFAYVCAGMMWFGSYVQRFSTFGSSSIALFGVLNGDDMINTFNMTYSHNRLWAFFSQIFMYSFVVFFTYTVLSILVTVLQESYILVSQELLQEKEDNLQFQQRLQSVAQAFHNTLEKPAIAPIAESKLRDWVKRTREKLRAGNPLEAPLIS